MARTLTEAERTKRNAAIFRTEFMHLSMAAVPIILVRTREPFRANDALKEFAFGEEDMEFRAWSCMHGWATYDRTKPNETPTIVPNSTAPLDALLMINGVGEQEGFGNGVFVMMYPHLSNLNKSGPMIHCIKEYARLFSENSKRLVLITTPEYELPRELSDDVVILDFITPSFAELDEAMDGCVEVLPEQKQPSFERDDRDRLVSICMGMTQHEFENAFSRAMVELRAQLPSVEVDAVADILAKCKMEVIKKTDVLELMETGDMSEIGGLEVLKEFFTR